MRGYSERLRVPVVWWLAPPAVTTTVWLSIQHVYGPRVSIPAGAAALMLTAAGLVAYGSVVVAVEPAGFVAGRARLPLWAVGEVIALEANRALAARGSEVDPRAFLLVRGYVPCTVRVTVDDPRDPVPYWLVSTRHPHELAAILSAARDSVR